MGQKFQLRKGLTRNIVLHKVLFQKSQIFKQDYLVAYVNPSALNVDHINLDAGVSKNLIDLIGINSPPIVLVPTNKSLPRTKDFRSILEHEFVHINQAIIGQFPETVCWQSDLSEISIYNNFIDNIKVEYDANLIQLITYPLFDPKEYGLTVDQWCVLRGFTQALEKIILSYTYSSSDLNKLISFCDVFQRKVVDSFKQLDLDISCGQLYATKLKEYIGISLKNFEDSNFLIFNNPKFMELYKWVSEDQLSDKQSSDFF